MNFENFKKQNKVIICTPIDETFSNEYISIREKENRVLYDKEVAILPNTSTQNPNIEEWKLRKQTSDRFVNYISKQNKKNILEIGCGNGWFSNAMASNSENFVVGLDVNIIELEQAIRIFEKKDLEYIYKDIFVLQTEFKNQFDIIVLNAAVQYFKNFDELIKTLKYYLKQNGEIHILDSHFYENEEISKAKTRSLEYYSKLGVPKMAEYYFHHSKDCVKDFEILYNGKSNIFDKVLRKKKSPFSWYKKTI